jgi:hypothetical protein
MGMVLGDENTVADSVSSQPVLHLGDDPGCLSASGAWIGNQCNGHGGYRKVLSISVLKRRHAGSDGLVKIVFQGIVTGRLPDSWERGQCCMAVWPNFVLHEYNIFSIHYGFQNQL